VITHRGQLITRRVADLRLHPCYLRHQLTVHSSKLLALARPGDRAFQQPIVITTGGIIVDGHGRYELARQQGEPTVPCLEYELNEADALVWLLQSHCGMDRLNPFCRTVLALDLEPHLQQQARSNQRAGGHSNLLCVSFSSNDARPDTCFHLSGGTTLVPGVFVNGLAVLGV
jgi:hypothetical protein